MSSLLSRGGHHAAVEFRVSFLGLRSLFIVVGSLLLSADVFCVIRGPGHLVVRRILRGAISVTDVDRCEVWVNLVVVRLVLARHLG